MSTALATLPEGWEDLGPAPVEPDTKDAPMPEGWQDLGPAEGVDLGPAETEVKITPINYGRFAAAHIALARRKARATGADLNINQQAAIMDAYRQMAKLPTLSNVDTFKEAQKHIAAHQGDVLNLARATSAAFERQAVNLVAPAVDAISPGWGTEVRRDIAAMNPFDPERISGKVGGLVASAPMLLGGGGAKTLAAIFGLDAMTEALATSTDTGVTGAAKWVGSASQGAITAASILVGGKIAEWATKGLAAEIPALQRLLTSGQTDAAAKIIAREAALAGINLPAQVASQVAGQIGNNLVASASTDPTRKWDDGLAEAAFMAAGMTIGSHIVRARAGVLSTRTPDAKLARAQEEAARTTQERETARAVYDSSVVGERHREPLRQLFRTVKAEEQAYKALRVLTPGTPEDIGGPVIEGTGYFPITRFTEGGPLATIPGERPRGGGPLFTPRDRGKVYSQPGPELPGTPREPLITPPAYPLATIPPEVGGPLVSQRPQALVTPPPGTREQVRTGPLPEDRSRVITPFPTAEQVTPMQTMELLQQAIRDTHPEPPPTVAADPAAFPGGRPPTISAGHRIQGTAGTGADPDVVYVSESLPQHLEIDGQVVDVHSFVAVHERVERDLMDAGETYEGAAHAKASAAEHAAVKAVGIDPVAYEKALAPYEALGQEIPLADAPPDLDGRPYKETPGGGMSEANLNRTPDGREYAIPHATYEIADQMSPARGAEFGPNLTENAGENLWVRPSTEQPNAKRTLLVAISDALTRTEPLSEGESRVPDFTAPPEWIGRAAENLPDSDVYVVRNVEEAAKFLGAAGYGKVAFSAADVSSPIVKALVDGYKGSAAVVGPEGMTAFSGDGGKAKTQKFKDGTDYRHFRDPNPPPAEPAPAAEPEPGLVQKIAEDEGGFIQFSHLASAASRVVRPITNLINDITGEMAWTVGKLPSGQALVHGLDWVASKAKTLVGRVANPAADAYQALPKADRRWLAATDAAGYSNFQRILEDTPSGRLTAPTQKIADIARVYQRMLDETGQEAMRVGVRAIAPDGTVVDFRQASTGRYLRNLTPDAFQAIHQGHGPLFDAIANAVARDNRVDLAQAGQFLREWLGPESVRRIGQIERLRAIKFMPTTVEVAGEKVAIQETDPLLAIMNNARRQAKRIYFIERFGQNVKGAPTHVERLRAEFQKDGGNVKEFDDLISVFEDRPYGRVFDDPRSPFARALRVADTLIATAQTSLSAIPNLPQTMILVPKYVGPVNFFKAIAEVIRHPKITAIQLSALGAMNRSVIDWSLRPGHGPEDFARIVRGVVARYTGLEAISQFNNQVAGIGFQKLAEGWTQNGISAGDLAVARDLRLTPTEIAAVQAGQMNPDIYRKIIQNGVSITQLITEDPHRMSKWQHIPIINGLFAYNNYAIGTAKAVMRVSRDTALAIKSGDPRQMTAAAGRIVMLLAGAVGAGTISVMLRRAVKGQEVVQSGEDAQAILQKALWEVALLGPTQRMHDAFDYSGGSTEKAMIGLSPKLSAVALVLAGLRGDGRWGNLPVGERAMKSTTRMVPLIRSMDAWVEKVAHPQVPAYDKVRSMAAVYRPREGPTPDVPVNPIYYHVHQAILREDSQELQQALDAHKEWAVAQGWDPEEARRRLRAALSARRPVNFAYATYREFLASLPEDKRRLAGDAQLAYTEAVDQLTLTPEELAARKGDIAPLRAAVGKGEIGKPAAKKVLETARQKPLQRQLDSASFTDAMRIWKLAPAEERDLIRRQVLEKARSQAQKVPKDGAKIIAQLRAEGVLPR